MQNLLIVTTLLMLSTEANAADPRILALEQAVERAPGELSKRLDLASALLGRYRFTQESELLSKARVHIEAARKLDAAHLLLRKMDALALLLSKDYRRALAVAEPLNRKIPDDVEVYGYLVEAYSAMGRLEDAEKQANWMLRLREQHRETMRRVAELRERLGDREGAILMLNEMYRLLPATETMDRAWVLARVARLKRGTDPARAEKLARQALELEPELFEGSVALAEVLDATGRKADAAKVREEMVRRVRGVDDVGLAESYIQKMRETADFSYLDRAEKLLRRVLEADSTNVRASMVQNQVLLFRHEFDRVIGSARELAGREPNHAAIWAMLGDALLETGRYEEAAEAYQKMVDLQPGLMSYNRVGWYRFLTGDMKGAQEYLLKAVQAGAPKHENTSWCFVELGHVYLKLGRLEASEAAFRMALEHFAGMHSAWAGLGRIFAAQGKWEDAIGALRKAQAMAPLPEYTGLLANLLVLQGKGDLARQELQGLDLIAKIEAASGQKANRQIALVFADHGHRLDEALEIAEADLKIRKDVYTYDAYAWVLFRNGRIEEARKAIDQALRTGAQEPLFFYHASRIARAQGELERSEEFLRKPGVQQLPVLPEPRS